MELGQNGAVRRLVLLVTVSGALACEARPPLDPDPVAAPSTLIDREPKGGSDASAPAGADAGSTGAAVVPAAALAQEVMRRWNLVVDSGNWTIDFHWAQVNEFPHPTFKFGTAEAYGEFASVLLAFFQRDDNFDFLAQNHLFTMQIRADTVSGQGDLVTSFEQLADYFSSSTAFGDIAPDVRDGLAHVAERIHQLT